MTIAALAVAAFAVSATAETVRAGNMVLTVGGNVSPKKLPRKRMAPITLRLNGHIRTVDGSHPPAARRMLLEFDRNGTIFSRGLPVCRPGQLEARTTRAAQRVCGKARVGGGQTKAQIQFAGQAPFTATGPLLIFNGPRKGRQPSLVMHVYAAVPAPTAFVIRGIVSNSNKRRFGKRVLIRVPTITGGAGSLTDFNAKIHRTWRFKGKKRSYLIARCRGGRFVARGDISFADGTRLVRNVVRPCRPR
ncbi:MAG TPA: hypothetical protein VFZ41_01405 [Solirubrobacterales bacterium]